MTHYFSGRPTVMTVDLAALRHNLAAIRARVGHAKIMATVKANAYGHGMLKCAETLQNAGVDAFGVALAEEGITLRQAGIRVPILVYGGLHAEQIEDYLTHDLDITAPSLEKIQAIDAAAMKLKKRARVHLKIDTGLGRIGVQHDRLPRFADGILACKNLDIIGVYSHLATAEDPDKTFAELQIQRFQASLDYLHQRGISWQTAHIANSGTVLNLPKSYFDMVRPGLSLYGVAPARHLENVLPLRPVMNLKSTVVYFKAVNAGQGISYGQTWHAHEPTRIVTLPIGYGDGILRAMSGCGEVLIRGVRHPMVGNICMDQLMVDIGPAGEAYNGDEVIIIGKQGTQSITVLDLAKAANTVPHEALTALNQRVPRIYQS
jgi:alanine racemase